jgi:uncharacterized membrane protein
MTHQDVITPAPGTSAGAKSALPEIRTIGTEDLKDALRKGWDDFAEMPSHAIFLSLLYPIVGLVIARAVLGYEIVPLLFPLAAGFALIGPFAAIGLYELSRRREAGLDTSWQHAFDVFFSPSFRAIATLGLLLLVIFGVWIAVAHAIYVANFGYREPESLTGFLGQVLTTQNGWNLILVGNAVGFLFALLVLAISVVAFPLLVDRHVTAMGAAATSVRAVLKNPLTMALWGLLVALALALGSLPFFFGLAVVIPVLGHATWHLYRKTVEPTQGPPEEYPRPSKEGRYAADFPASLFPSSRERP